MNTDHIHKKNTIMQLLAICGATAKLMIIFELAKDLYGNLFHTHPPPLREMDILQIS